MIGNLKTLLIAAAGLLLAACSSNSDDKASGSATAQTEQAQTADAASQGSITADHGDYVLEGGRIRSPHGRPMVADFYADWCPPCRKLRPIFEKMKEKYAGQADFVSINVDQEQALAASYGVQSIPTLAYIMPDGRVAATTTGLLTETELEDNIKELIESAD